MFKSASNVSITGGRFTVLRGNSVHYHGIRDSSDILHRATATAAFHNSDERFDPPKCHPNSRPAVLSKIMEWIEWKGDLNTFILWVYGPAGAGKSAIAQTIAEMCEEEILLAGFFFSRDDPSRNNVKPLIATIAYQISLNLPDVRDPILEAVKRDPLIFSKALAVQFKTLIVEPLQPLVEAGFFNEPSSRRLVIIDGLDECSNPKVQQNILEVLGNAQRQHRLPLIFLFASRPEQHISLAFSTGLLPSVTSRIALDESYNMKLTSSLGVLASTLPSAVDASSRHIPNEDLDPEPPTPCPKGVPLFRAFSPGWKDHFYTTDQAEMQRATTNLGFTAGGITGYIFPTQEPETVPLYRLYHPTTMDHCYTVDKAESDDAANKLGYNYEGIAGYVYPPSAATNPFGALPLYRVYNAAIRDHFYTMSAGESDNAVANHGYTKEGIAAYILPASVPLLRAFNPGWTDHFYTTDQAEMQRATTSLGFTAEGITGYIFPSQEPDAVPLYRLYHPTAMNHFYTVYKAESDNAANELGYNYEGIAGYVYPPSATKNPSGALPLYRLYNAAIVDHFYTMSAGESDNAAANCGYTKEGIAAYILPAGVPLLRAFNPGSTDHFYTADQAEMQRATSSLGFSAEGITGYIFPTQEPDTVPLYRLYHPTTMDHFYTIDKAESDNAANNIGYTYEGICGYVYPPSATTKPCGAEPLYRLYNTTLRNHFYTMSAGESDNAAASLGYSKEGIAGYILPACFPR